MNNAAFATAKWANDEIVNHWLAASDSNAADIVVDALATLAAESAQTLLLVQADDAKSWQLAKAAKAAAKSAAKLAAAVTIAA